MKTNRSVFKIEPEVLPCFEVNYKFSFATTRKQENPVNTAQKMVSQSSTKQNGEATTEKVPGSIVTYTEEEINTLIQRRRGPWKQEKEYAACNRLSQ